MEQECKGPIHPVVAVLALLLESLNRQPLYYICFSTSPYSCNYNGWAVLVLLHIAVIKTVGLLVEQNECTFFFLSSLVFLPPDVFFGCWAMLLSLSLYHDFGVTYLLVLLCLPPPRMKCHSSWHKACHLAEGKGICLQLASLLLCWPMFVLTDGAQPGQLTRGRQLSLMLTDPRTHVASFPASLGLEFRGWCLILNKLMLQSFPHWGRIFFFFLLLIPTNLSTKLALALHL